MSIAENWDNVNNKVRITQNPTPRVNHYKHLGVFSFQPFFPHWYYLHTYTKGSSWAREKTWVSCTAGRFFTNWATREARLVAQPFPNVDPKIQLQQGLWG